VHEIAAGPYSRDRRVEFRPLLALVGR